MQKILKFISVESVECLLMRMRRRKRRKNDTFCTSLGRDNQIATGAKLLGTMYESYGFSGDLVETTTNEYQYGKTGFSHNPHWYV